MKGVFALETFFTKKDTMATKGFAIFLLLFHHLFYASPEFSINILGVNVFNKLAIASRVTVAIFIILSGYGLTESTKNKKLGILRFYYKRYSKLFVSYWVIFLIFVPIGVFVFGRTIHSVYGNHSYIKLIVEFFGLQEFVFGHGYNPTWWFMSAIILLYALFPLLYFLIKRYSWLPLVLLARIMFSEIHMSEWLLPFGIGIFLSLHLTPKWQERIKRFLFTSKTKAILLLISLIVIAIYLRFHHQFFRNQRLDSFLGLSLISLNWILIKSFNFLNRVFTAFGKVSMEIFLFHTFIYFYFYRNFFYSLQNPILMVGVLALVCLIIGIVLNKLCSKIYSVIPQ